MTIDEAGISALYRAHVPDAMRLAYVMIGDTAAAQDIAHDSFLKAASKLRLMNDAGRFGSYLRRTVVRTVLMRHRSAGREQARAELAARKGTSQVGDPAGNTCAHVDLMTALRTLPPRQQAALFLRYWLDLPEAEIAEAIGCRRGTVKSTLARALDTLREVIPDV